MIADIADQDPGSARFRSGVARLAARSSGTAKHGWQTLNTRSSAVTGGLVFAILSVLYLLTASYDTRQSVDAIAAALPAWQLATHGNLDLSSLVQPDHIWFLETDQGLVSNRHLGIILFAVPLYWLSQPFTSGPTMIPAAIAAALATAGGITCLHLAFRRLVPPSTAVGAALVAGLATSSWSVSADALWPHGIDQLWLGLAVLLIGAERSWSSGIAFGLAVLTRPLVVVAGGTASVFEAWRRRTWQPVLAVSLFSLVALSAVLAYNWRLFGEPSITGGYSNDFSSTFLTMGLLEYGRNLAFTLISDRGVLLWSPFLLLLIPGLRAGWRAAPTWVKSATLGGALYMVLHLRLNRYSGGDAFWTYRYPIESLTMAAPLFLLSYREWTSQLVQRRRFFAKLVALSVAIQGTGATFYHLAL